MSITVFYSGSAQTLGVHGKIFLDCSKSQTGSQEIFSMFLTISNCAVITQTHWVPLELTNFFKEAGYHIYISDPRLNIECVCWSSLNMPFMCFDSGSYHTQQKAEERFIFLVSEKSRKDTQHVRGAPGAVQDYNWYSSLIPSGWFFLNRIKTSFYRQSNHKNTKM